MPLSLILFDIDSFKRYNDSYGHQSGGACLARIGQMVRQGNYARRPGDLVARYGGEEFAVILSGTGPEFARKTGRRLCNDAAALKIAHPRTEVKDCDVVTLSVGVATIEPLVGVESAALVAAADAALYRAKDGGRNRCEIAPEATTDEAGDARFGGRDRRPRPRGGAPTVANGEIRPRRRPLKTGLQSARPFSSA